MRRVLLRARARARDDDCKKKNHLPLIHRLMRKAPLASVQQTRVNRKTRLEKSDHKTTTRRTFSTLKDDAFTGTFATTLFVCEFCIRIVGATTFAEEATAYMMMMMMFLFDVCV